MDLVFSSWQDVPFTENHIKQLHQTLLPCSEKDTRHRGNDKTSPNSVAAFDESGTQIGRVTMGETIKLTGASRNTLRQHLRALVERGTLNQHGSGRGVWYDLR